MLDIEIASDTPSCPVHEVDERKATRPQQTAGPKGLQIGDAAVARQILRGRDVKQAGFKADLIERFRTAHPPVLFQDGPAHQKQRSATARFFAPKTVNSRYRGLMTDLAKDLTRRVSANGSADLTELSFEMAVALAAEIVGLTNSDRAGMANRLSRFFSFNSGRDANALRAALSFAKGQVLLAQFFFRDVRPAIRARRSEPREDVISHLIGEGYSDREILTECLTYGAAGMATTREFITMAAWHLLENNALRQRFLAGGDAEQAAILEEILRVEPVVGSLYRRATHDIAIGGRDAPVAAGDIIEIDIAAANADPEAVGRCPHAVEPGRLGAGGRPVGPAMSFGDGPHRCPGTTVAMVESAIFLDHLLRVPGVRLSRAPDVHWNPLIASYELRNAMVSADRTSA